MRKIPIMINKNGPPSHDYHQWGVHEIQQESTASWEELLAEKEPPEARTEKTVHGFTSPVSSFSEITGFKPSLKILKRSSSAHGAIVSTVPHNDNGENGASLSEADTNANTPIDYNSILLKKRDEYEKARKLIFQNTQCTASDHIVSYNKLNKANGGA